MWRLVPGLYVLRRHAPGFGTAPPNYPLGRREQPAKFPEKDGGPPFADSFPRNQRYRAAVENKKARSCCSEHRPRAPSSGHRALAGSTRRSKVGSGGRANRDASD